MHSSDVLHVPVYTQLGTYLGRVSSFDVDVVTHQITSYHVRTGLIKGLWYQELLIAPRQVISLTEEKMVVEDTAIPAPAIAAQPVNSV